MTRDESAKVRVGSSEGEVSMTFVVAVNWVAQEGPSEEIEAILRELVRKTREESGCIDFIAHRSRSEPGEFFLYERYQSEDAWQQHQKTAHFTELVLKRAVPLLARRERRTFSILE
jgi:quinol monooxygenase YgiN